MDYQTNLYSEQKIQNLVSHRESVSCVSSVAHTGMLIRTSEKEKELKVKSASEIYKPGFFIFYIYPL